MKFKLLTLLLLSLVLMGNIAYHKDALLVAYDKNFQQFQETDLGNLISQIGKEILEPGPLNVGGKANNATFSSQQVIIETNSARQTNGNLPPLLENAKLNAAAKVKAQDMFTNQYFDHVSPSGVGPAALVSSQGYEYIITGENLILGNFKGEKEVVQLWMNSPGHRANILNNRFTEIGVAMVKGQYKGETVWIGVQEFGLPLSSCPEPSVSLKNTIEANRTALDQLAAQIDMKRKEIENTSRRSEKYNQLVDEYNALVAEYNPLNDETKKLIAQYNAQVNNFNQCAAGK